MRRALCKTHHFVFDRRAVAWANSFDLTTVHGGLIKAATDNVMGMLGGASNMATNLTRIIGGRTKKGESRRRIIAWLNLKCGKIDGAAINPRRCARLKPSGPRTQFAQAVGKRQCWRISRTAAGLTVEAYVNTPI